MPKSYHGMSLTPVVTLHVQPFWLFKCLHRKKSVQTLDLATVCTFCTNICTNQRSLILKSPNLPQNHDSKMSLLRDGRPHLYVFIALILLLLCYCMCCLSPKCWHRMSKTRWE